MATAAANGGSGGAVAVAKQPSGLIPAEERRAIIALDQTLQDGRREIAEAEASGSLMMKGMTTARVMQQVREMITPKMMQDVMKLMNTPVGFKTDRDPARSKQGTQPYPVETVRDVLIQALMDGARPVGNEFNIISGQYYRTKEQFERRIAEWPGLKQFKYSLGVPTIGQHGALVSGWASWKLNGAADRIDCKQEPDGIDSRIPVRINEGQGADAILGKATRKLLARVYKRLSGEQVEDDDEPTSDGGHTIDTTFHVVETPAPTPAANGMHGEDDPVWTYETRFLEADSIDAADGIMAEAAAELTDTQLDQASAWHHEALARLADQGAAEEEARETAAPHPLDGVWDKLNACEQKRDVERVYLEATKIEGLSEDDAKMLFSWRGQTLQRITDSRGSRASGGKQKELEGAK